MMPRVATAMASAAGVKVGMAAPSATILGTKAAGSAPRSRPKSSLSWLARMITPIPAVKPTVTG